MSGSSAVENFLGYSTIVKTNNKTCKEITCGDQFALRCIDLFEDQCLTCGIFSESQESILKCVGGISSVLLSVCDAQAKSHGNIGGTSAHKHCKLPFLSHLCDQNQSFRAAKESVIFFPANPFLEFNVCRRDWTSSFRVAFKEVIFMFVYPC